MEQAREARQQRRAMLLFSLAMLVLLGFCGFAGLRMLTLPAKLYPVGRVSDFADGKPRQVSVPKLEISSLIARRDTSVSEDTVFVRRDSDGSWVALLGLDTLSGCFLFWDANAGLFQDVSCLGARYTPDGRYLDGLKGGEQPQDMARLVVEVEDDQVFVRDERARER